MEDHLSIVYLAAPYTHPEESVVIERFNTANKVAAILMNKGYNLISPISMTRPIALAGDLPHHWQFWENFDRALLSVCNTLTIIDIPGWRESKGVTAEIAIAKEFGLQINMVDVNGEFGKFEE